MGFSVNTKIVTVLVCLTGLVKKQEKLMKTVTTRVNESSSWTLILFLFFIKRLFGLYRDWSTGLC